jgi:hypothetical protein
MFRAYKPPPRNASRDTINSAATAGGSVLGALAGAKLAGPEGALAGAQAGAGIGGAAAGLFGGGEQQEQRVGSGLGLSMMAAQKYFENKKNYGEVQTKDGGKEPASGNITSQLKPMASSMMMTSPIPTDVMNEETNPSKWNYRGRPMMSKPIY